MAEEKGHNVVSFLGDIFGHKVGDLITSIVKTPFVANATERHEAVQTAKRQARPRIVLRTVKTGSELTEIIAAMNRPIMDGTRVIFTQRDVEEIVCVAYELLRAEQDARISAAKDLKSSADAILAELRKKNNNQREVLAQIEQARVAAERAATALEALTQGEPVADRLLVYLDSICNDAVVWRQTLTTLDNDTGLKRAQRAVRNRFSDEGCGELADAIDNLF